LRDCEIRDGRSDGVWVDNGLGTIEKCVISTKGGACVQISYGGNPTVRDCQISGTGDGVWVDSHGQGTIERCVISGNGWHGVLTRQFGHPVIRDCEIRDNGRSGVIIEKLGQGTFTGNTLTGNHGGAWLVDSTAEHVNRTGNRPNA